MPDPIVLTPSPVLVSLVKPAPQLRRKPSTVSKAFMGWF